MARCVHSLCTVCIDQCEGPQAAGEPSGQEKEKVTRRKGAVVRAWLVSFSLLLLSQHNKARA